jgi:hypothetical protein
MGDLTCSCGTSPCTGGKTVASCNAADMVRAFGAAQAAGLGGKVVAACDATAL